MPTRPDFSNYLIHFTKGTAPVGVNSNPVFLQKRITAQKRLQDILSSKTILASNMPWTGRPAVCFTECVWSSLFAHAQRYSAFGIGFTKEFVFRQDGNPVFYVRPSLFNGQQWGEPLKGFTTPFAPEYGDEHMNGRCRNPIDFTHEREWRVLHDFTFEYSDIAFIILPSPKYLHIISSRIQQTIGGDNILFMSNYRKIVEFWPTHHIDN